MNDHLEKIARSLGLDSGIKMDRPTMDWVYDILEDEEPKDGDSD